MAVVNKEGNKLISQGTYDEPLLTAIEGKWYGFYKLGLDGSVEEIPFDNNEILSDGWRDHCIVPKNFHDLAQSLLLGYDSDTFAQVCRRFVEYTLDGDWTRLHEHLPKSAVEKHIFGEYMRKEQFLDELTDLCKRFNLSIEGTENKTFKVVDKVNDEVVVVYRAGGKYTPLKG
jgi:hypothetical protein